MNDDDLLVPPALVTALRGRFALVAEQIQPADDVLVEVRRRYAWRRAGSGLVLLASAAAVAGIAVLAPGLLSDAGTRDHPVEVHIATTTPSRSGAAPELRLSGHQFTLPAGFSVTRPVERTSFGAADGQPSRSSVLEAGDGLNEVLLATYQGQLGVDAGQQAQNPHVFGTTPARHIMIAGRDAVVGVVSRLPASKECRFTLPPTPNRTSGPGGVQTTCGVAPLPHITIELQLASQLHLSMSSSGLSEDQAVAIVASGLP